MTDYYEIRGRPRVEARVPIVIFSEQGVIVGESRKITGTGIFLRCNKKLHRNEIYRMALRLSAKQPVVLRGELIGSNVDGIGRNNPLSDAEISFVKIFEEDRQLLSHRIIAYLQEEKRRRQKLQGRFS